MDFNKIAELIKLRRTIHDYEAKPSSWEEIKNCLELGLWSMNHKHTHPWRFFRTGPKVREELAHLMVELKSVKKARPSDAIVHSMKEKILNPSEVLLLAQPSDVEPHQLLEDYATISGAVHLIALGLCALGLGSKWSTGGWTTHPKTYELLGIDPSKLILRGALIMGWAKHPPPMPSRPLLEEVLFETH
ncbi:MAG: nitroreductase family protein [Bdellovibrionales bacterium]|nr:nitroreductase family protein [Bdellovibrionales bacterium]